LLGAREHFQNALGADGTYEYVELPTDRLIRRMNVRLYYTGYEPWYVADELRMTEDSGKREVFNWDTEVLYRFHQNEYPPIMVRAVVGITTSAQYYYLPPSDYWICGGSFDQGTGSKPMGINGATGTRGGKIALIGTATAYHNALFSGYLPWSTYDFKMGDLMDMEDWYDPANKGKVELRIKSHSAGTSGAAAIVLEQLRRY